MVNRRKGVGTLGCLLTMVLLGAVLWFGYNIGIKYWNFYQYQDRMKSEARFAQHRGDPLIRSRLKLYADSLNLPEGAGNVTVRRRRGTIHIFADYYEIIEFPLFAKEKHFHPEAVGTF